MTSCLGLPSCRSLSSMGRRLGLSQGVAVLGRVVWVCVLVLGAVHAGAAHAGAEDAGAEDVAAAADGEAPALRHDGETHLTEIRQLTFVGENAEAYWSPAGDELILQSTSPPYECDQIFRLDIDRPGELELVSTGRGRTTCAYFHAQGERLLYASTHAADAACPPVPDHSKGYVWPLYDSFEIYSAALDGSDLVALTDNAVYDAEATVCSQDGAILFTSTRDGDLDLYRMDADGSNVQRLTETPGYDGGAFFSADCSRIVWRASRPQEGPELEDYQALLAQGLVRPSKLEIFVANADGSEARQVTYLGAASFAPYFFPDGQRIIFSSNYGDARGREFDIWAIDVDGTDLERVTFAPGFDGFPMFSPDGRHLAFASNRNQAQPGWTDVYVARWQPGPAAETPTAEAPTALQGDGAGRAEDRLAAEVAWLADDARQGRGIGTAGLDEAAQWLAKGFADLGLEAAGEEGSFLQAFQVPVAVEAADGTALSVDGKTVAADDFSVATSSSSGTASGEIVAVGFGISAAADEAGFDYDDYAGLDVDGKVVLIRRFTPEHESFVGRDHVDRRRRFGDLRYKAWNAREHGAAGVLIADLPSPGEDGEVPAEAPLPSLRVTMSSDAGLPVMILRRSLAAPLLEGNHRVEMTTVLHVEEQTAHNVVARLPAGAATPQAGAVVIGAHYDHLGLGGAGSLEPDAEEPHNGADDNASGTAALLHIGRQLIARRQELQRDVYLVAFSGEESGLRGSTHFTRHPPAGLGFEGDDGSTPLAMLNLDMVGRLRNNRVAALGAGSAAEWGDILPSLCRGVGIDCDLGGDGYGPSDQTPFFAAGVPVLHFFTGSHSEYHRPADDAELLNYSGLARIGDLVSEVALTVAARPEALTYVSAAAPLSGGDSRSFGASMGTIPDYADDRPGVLLAGTRPGGPAERAGLQRGDRLVELDGHEVRDIYDFMYVLRRAKPGESAVVVVDRQGHRLALEVTFGQSERGR